MRFIAGLYTRRNVLHGLLIYSAGDSAAALLLERFTLTRCAGMMAVGGLIYALEIPRVFAWIERRAPADGGTGGALTRTVLALLYFNPLWIARHLAFIALSEGSWERITTGLLVVGLRSFAVNIPLSLAANFVIQNLVPSRSRFLASAVFSAIMALYYALSEVVFS
jgi:hypothetical protein